MKKFKEGDKVIITKAGNTGSQSLFNEDIEKLIGQVMIVTGASSDELYLLDYNKHSINFQAQSLELWTGKNEIIVDGITYIQKEPVVKKYEDILYNVKGESEGFEATQVKFVYVRDIEEYVFKGATNTETFDYFNEEELEDILDKLVEINLDLDEE